MLFCVLVTLCSFQGFYGIVNGTDICWRTWFRIIKHSYSTKNFCCVRCFVICSCDSIPQVPWLVPGKMILFCFKQSETAVVVGRRNIGANRKIQAVFVLYL